MGSSGTATWSVQKPSQNPSTRSFGSPLSGL
ncbi:hypothetical protein CGRA01v4_09012 [Colletotrichum graminicola]|nr:hypothetical protein CGRA01v4_09012 [Colletotrichum graminicola]